MKQKLEKILKKPDIDRNLSWFWSKYVTRSVCSYAYFMNMLNGGRAELREDVRVIIADYIKKHAQD